jgi:thiol-disulfide isomerase/thioredoxin
MDSILIMLLFLVAVWMLLAPLAAWWRARRSLDRVAPDTGAVDGAYLGERRVYFFHASHCPHCRAVQPLVERLRGEFPSLIPVDVAEFPQLALGFDVTATPSFVAVEAGIIRAVQLGAVNEQWLRARL